MTGGRTDEVVDLFELAERLVAELAEHAAGRTARTVVSGSSLRTVVIALKEGTELAEHDAPTAGTLYCLSGRVSLDSGDRSQELGPGQLLPIPSVRHSVRAHADSAVLLTVALR
ncbi:cupin domain-containing protein [Nocardioides mesophilus]|uniref:Cupin domain-containing protein n=2 Tax=Nocardioides mesophilus TaxID=433659 RepID=A0A7G9RH52_9ACTN|nr:cupin domain-containing protein [Nocardioides mesophilus]